MVSSGSRGRRSVPTPPRAMSHAEWRTCHVAPSEVRCEEGVPRGAKGGEVRRACHVAPNGMGERGVPRGAKGGEEGSVHSRVRLGGLLEAARL